MLAEVVDAVIGGDTHRDTHALDLTAPTGVTIATLSISNDERGLPTRFPGSPSMPPARGSSSPSRALAATGSGYAGRCRRPG
jgi:hypothetical protein